MASARKKLDEKNLKVLRELVSLPENKHCFDCHQRGPTYVNVTIGSFVCTRCSGMLRGLTPPHRVKSISMATFTSEEIDLLKTRGNEFCRKVWLGLYDGEQLSKDEQQIKEFMIAKYEKKRYYVKPSETDKMSNGPTVNNNSHIVPKLPSSTSFSFSVPNSNNNLSRNHNNNLFTSQPVNKPRDVPKMPAQDPFSSLNSSTPNSGLPVDNFANFDNNPVFNGPHFNQNTVPIGPVDNKVNGPPPPSEDRYAALKDLDCLMKSQQMATQQPENTVVSNSEWDPGNIWSVQSNNQTNLQPNPTTTSAFFESVPPVLNASVTTTKDFNPFAVNNTEATWVNAFAGNPFNVVPEFSWASANGTTNGLPASQPFNFHTNKQLWNFGSTANPFSVSTNGQSVSQHSSNPFL